MRCRRLLFPRRILTVKKLSRFTPALLLAVHTLLIHNLVIPIDETPEAFSGEDIVVLQVSDLHFGDRIRRSHRRAARIINRIDPDILLITGDSVNFYAAQETLGLWLSGLEVAEGRRYAVLGNWEYKNLRPRDRMTETYGEHGVRLLVNEAEELEVKGRRLRIVGLDDDLYGTVSDSVFHGSTDETTELIMVHEPFVADRISERVSGSTVFSGHTHGGQILFFGKALYTPPGSGPYLEGSYAVGGNRLIVSRGIGTSSLSARLGPEPDVRILRLPSDIRP